MPDLAGASVWVEIDGERLQEFGVEHDENAKVVTCWVPCQTGKEFRFGVSLEEVIPREANYRFKLRLDGKGVRSYAALPNRTIRKNVYCDNSKPRYFKGQHEETGLRPFRFANVKITDDDSHMGDVSSLGELVVTIETFKEEKRVKKAPPIAKGGKDQSSAHTGETVVHEEAKKGLTNCVQFGELRPQPGPAGKGEGKDIMVDVALDTVVSGTATEGATDILIADGIAPRLVPAPAHVPPQQSPVPATARRTASPGVADVLTQRVKKETIDLDFDDDAQDEAQIRRLKARVAALQEMHDLNAQIEALESKKRARIGEGSSQTTKRVKKEPKVEPFVPGEIIDLT